MATKYVNTRWPDGYDMNGSAEVIELDSHLPKPDPLWEWTDGAGHVHRNVPRTYVFKREPDEFDEDGEVVPGATWAECPLCGEVVRFGTRVSAFRDQVTGPMRWVVTYPDATELEITRAQHDEVRAAMEQSNGELVRLVLERIRAEAS